MNSDTNQDMTCTGSCTCTEFQPLQMFVSGVGGTGKSFLIEAIRANFLTCAVAALTVLAAFNIGVIVCHLLQLLIEHEARKAQYWAVPTNSLKMMRNTLGKVKLVIVD